ncbi:related to Extracellular metalloprotease VDBG_01143 [Rhynchosporium secalis]|uniref:Related to Extracellular metalloprotease VDBG_01143 n=1 Tax=Rhynchosporium secalis TaxID=38038 RepID=A0A1E1M5T6_RHYSE|nr:related to Extracellular metalloprotease VDBG_01143 [Rhynchosporium secalis]
MARFAFLALAASILSTVSAHPANGPRDTKFGCGVVPTPEFIAAAQAIAAEEEAQKASLGASLVSDVSALATTTVNVYFHVVSKSNAVSGGYVSASQITQQLAVLNSNYAASGFAFVSKGVDYTINTSWASDGNEIAMKKALRKGTYKDLNIYYQYAIGGNLGYCYFPTTAAAGSNDFYLDGCSILYSTAPGGPLANYNLGKTATHEVGHWMGLFHTFQGSSCSGSGDSISDTPQQLSPSSGCPTGRDSCPNAAGLDPIHNYMDYSYDTCYESFTPNQATRMNSMWNTYRAKF